MQTAVLTLLALLAFAANSLLCRQALGAGLVDPVGFTALRLLSGALALLVLLSWRQGRFAWRAGSWQSAFWLLLYAAGFSYAYLQLTTATGALILFAWVQLTMVLVGLRNGVRPDVFQWSGLLLAGGGLLCLLLPGLTAPDPLAALLMALAGIAWGLYSLRGRAAVSPLLATGGNFLKTLPLLLPLLIWNGDRLHLTAAGGLLAVLSGALASACGYLVWYAALPGLSTTLAATVQLSVPVLAALGGIFLLDEAFSLRLLLAATLILAGIGLAVLPRR